MFALGLEFSLRSSCRSADRQNHAIFSRAHGGWVHDRRALAGRCGRAVTGHSSPSRRRPSSQGVRGAGIKGKLRELVVGVLVSGSDRDPLDGAPDSAGLRGGLTAGTLVWSSARLAGFLVGLVVVGLILVPRSIRAIVRLGRPETTLVAAVGICFACALLAQAFGYSVALGAFLAGSLVAESGEEKTVEHLVIRYATCSPPSSSSRSA